LSITRDLVDAITTTEDSLPQWCLDQISQQGKALVFQGDFPYGRELLGNIQHQGRSQFLRTSEFNRLPIPEQWNAHRYIQFQTAHIIQHFLVRLDKNHKLVDCRRAIDYSGILSSLHHPNRIPKQQQQQQQSTEMYVMPLQEILSRNGVYQSNLRGIYIPSLQEYIHPRYGVYPPTRNEYLDLIRMQPLPSSKSSFSSNSITMMDVGCGTGVITALLLKQHPNTTIRRAIGTDINPAAIECADDNLKRLGLSDRAQFLQADLFPNAQQNMDPMDLIVCNPPWIPGLPSSRLEQAIFDPDSQFLKRFLLKAKGFLKNNNTSQIWLVLSDFPELLGLRTREELYQMIDDGGLFVASSKSTQPVHLKARDSKQKNRSNQDPFPEIAKMRSRERTFLYELRRK
jgi:methylase of polypeptide subunit release factors